MLAITVVALLYAPLLMARTNGQTLGRMATGIRVVRANGGPMTFGFAMLREVARQGRCCSAIAGALTFGLARLLDVLWPLWDEENRALHDFVVEHARGARRLTAGGQVEVRRARRARRPRSAAGLGPDDLVAARPDADQRDRHADEVRDVGEVVARGLRAARPPRGSRVMSSSQPGSSSYSPVAWCMTVWW